MIIVDTCSFETNLHQGCHSRSLRLEVNVGPKTPNKFIYKDEKGVRSEVNFRTHFTFYLWSVAQLHQCGRCGWPQWALCFRTSHREGWGRGRDAPRALRGSLGDRRTRQGSEGESVPSLSSDCWDQRRRPERASPRKHCLLWLRCRDGSLSPWTTLRWSGMRWILKYVTICNNWTLHSQSKNQR